MRSILFLFFISFAYISTAQDHPTCDGARYIDDVFIDLDSTFAVSYGSGTTIAGNEQELFFDVFEPAGDSAEDRPVVVLAFGGSFIGGTREDMHWICKRYAQKGFVAVSIDYRLYDLPLFPIPTELEMKEVVTKAVGDMKAAVRYLRADADGTDQFRIDPDLIFVGGLSAGGIVACHTAFLDEEDSFPQDLLDIFDAEGGLEGTTNDLDYPSDVQGILNFSGGLNDSKWIDENDPPLLSVHESGDGTVPFNGGFASIFTFDIIYMEGSGLLKTVADSVGIQNIIRVIDANTHTAYFFDDELTIEIIDWSSAFLHDQICEDKVLNDQEINPALSQITIYPNPSSGILNFDYDLLDQHSLNIFDLQGRKLMTASLRHQLDIGHLETGMYLIEIKENHSTQSVIKKIILE